MLNAMEIRNALGAYSNYLRNIAANPDQIVEDQFDSLPVAVKEDAVRVAKDEFTKVVAQQAEQYAASQRDLDSILSSYGVQTTETLSAARVRVDEFPTLEEGK